MANNSAKQRTQSKHLPLKSNTRDGRESRKDSRVSLTSKRIMEEFSTKRQNLMKELANR